MNKKEFLTQLQQGLSGLPKDDVEERVAFYAEMIDDRIDDGVSEEQAINDIGPISEVVNQIIADIPLTKLVKEKIKPARKIKAWEIVLLVLGSPLWLAFLITAFALVLTLYIVLWVLIITVWAIFVSFVVVAVFGVVAGIVFAAMINSVSGMVLIAGGIVCAGLSIFAFFGCKAATKGILKLTKKLAISIKNCFIKKERV